MPGVPPSRFVYLGPEGTFTEQALLTLPAAQRGTCTPVRSVPEALDAVRAGDADAALVPLENSVGGAIAVTLDELLDGDPLMITREIVLPVNFALAARSPVPVEQLRRIAAHPQASSQCRRWLRLHAPDAEIVDVLSNAAAAVGAADGSYEAAICAPLGASRYRLSVLADLIADRADAVTRFVLIGRPGPPPPPTGDDVTSLAVEMPHDKVGALLAVLMEIAVRGVNLTRIESRPTGEKLGRYTFFLDCGGHVAQTRLGEALCGLHRICDRVHFLGSYPRHRWDGKIERTANGVTDDDFAASAAWLARLRSGEPT